MTIIEGLTKIEQDILDVIKEWEKTNNHSVPLGFSYTLPYNELGVSRYSEEDIKRALENLVQKTILNKKDDGSYKLTEDAFRVLMKKVEITSNKLNFNKLTKLHKKILKKMILSECEHHSGVVSNTLHRYFFYEQYTKKKIYDALEELVKLGFITKERKPLDYGYKFTRDQYIAIKKHFKWWFRWQTLKKKVKILFIWLWKHFIITIITSAITALVTVKITQWLK